MQNFRMPNGNFSLWSIYAVFLLLSVCGRCLAEHCHQNELQQCTELVKPIMQNVSIGFAASSEQLDAVCNLFNEGMACINRFVSRCFQESQRILFRQNLAGVEEVMTKLCTDGEYRKEYLSHASCFLSVAPQYEECGGVFRTSVGNINQNQEENSAKLPKMCSALHRFLECAYGLTSQHCGERGKSASEFLRSYTEKAVGSLITSTCRKIPTDGQSHGGKVIELDEADGLREVNGPDEAATTMSWLTTKKARKGKGKGGRSRNTTPGFGTTPMSRLPGPDTARSQAGAPAKKDDKKSGAPYLSSHSLWSTILPVSIFIISTYRWTTVWT